MYNTTLLPSLTLSLFLFLSRLHFLFSVFITLSHLREYIAQVTRASDVALPKRLLRNTRRVNLYRRGKAQRAQAKGTVSRFSSHCSAIFKLLERVRLPSRNSLSVGNMFVFTPCRRATTRPAFGGSLPPSLLFFSHSFVLLGIKFRGYLLRYRTVTVLALYGTDFSFFFLSGTSAAGKYRVSEFAGRSRSAGRFSRARRKEKSCRGFSSRGEQSRPFTRGSVPLCPS